MIEGYYGCKALEIFVFVVLIPLEDRLQCHYPCWSMMLSRYSDFKKFPSSSSSSSFFGVVIQNLILTFVGKQLLHVLT